jgi:hypothetical protein
MRGLGLCLGRSCATADFDVDILIVHNAAPSDRNIPSHLCTPRNIYNDDTFAWLTDRCSGSYKSTDLIIPQRTTSPTYLPPH